MKNKKIICLLVLVLVVFGLASCNKKNKNDVELDDEGNVVVRPGQEATIVDFWFYGDEIELEVYKKLVSEFNKKNEGAIKIKMAAKPSDGYSDALNLTLQGSNAPDIFYISEIGFKQQAEQGTLLDITDYVNNSKDYVVADMWDSAVSRFQYDVNTKTNDGPNKRFYGVPKDIGPTVIYYNETMFERAGVTSISVAAEDLEAFNNNEKADDRGKKKSEYGIDCVVKEKGYFVDNSGNKWFNNQIPMNWDEVVTLARLIQDNQADPNTYGYFTEWWFNYGWTVGGDCIQWIESDAAGYTGGYWDFTLMDDSKNYIVADDADPFEINGHTYKPGEIISYQDKLVNEVPTQMGVMDTTKKEVEEKVLQACASGQLNELPSQREAFVEFVRLGTKTNVVVDTVNGENLMGYGVCPSPKSIGSDAEKTRQFSSKKVAMLVDVRAAVTQFRKTLTDKWDVAPLPMYKEYDAEGNVTVHGVEAGHSGSIGIGIWAKTKVANAAWKFVEFIGGRYGQAEQSKTGFAIPLQRDLAKDEEIFLQTNQSPRNSKIFIPAAERQIAGDWWYLKDNEWIHPWANLLNGSVRNGDLTLSGFYNSTEYAKTYATLLKYTEKTKK